jgi:hypothetical protein
MHKELIGQHASLSLPCSVDATALLLGFIEELMEVSGDETGDPGRLESDLRAAVAAICAHRGENGVVQVLANIEIHDRGVDVRLTCENPDAADLGISEQLVVAHEA